MKLTMKPLCLLVILFSVLGFNQGAFVTANAQRDYQISVITHDPGDNTYWLVLRRGVEQAAIDMQVKVTYQTLPTFDMEQMADFINTAVDDKVDGLIISIPDPSVLGASIINAVNAGIPVISLDSGSDVTERFGILTHLGQDEYAAGLEAGNRLVRAGATNGLCINPEVGNIGLDLRCLGFSDAMEDQGATVRTLAVDQANPNDVKQRVITTLSSNNEVDSLLIVGESIVDPILLALEEMGTTEQYLIGMFDLNAVGLRAVDRGDILFAVDSQQYMMGYLAVVYMTLYLDNLNVSPEVLIPTGPGFVTQETAAKVLDLAEAGTR